MCIFEKIGNVCIFFTDLTFQLNVFLLKSVFFRYEKKGHKDWSTYIWW